MSQVVFSSKNHGRDQLYLFHPIEECLRETFLPALIGRKISDAERKIFALPVRLSGLGIANPVETCDREYRSSLAITEDLTDLIYRQEQDLSHFNAERQTSLIKELKAGKERSITNRYNEIIDATTEPSLKRALVLNKEKGSGTWLTVLPLQDHGFVLNK